MCRSYKVLHDSIASSYLLLLFFTWSFSILAVFGVTLVTMRGQFLVKTSISFIIPIGNRKMWHQKCFGLHFIISWIIKLQNTYKINDPQKINLRRIYFYKNFMIYIEIVRKSGRNNVFLIQNRIFNMLFKAWKFKCSLLKFNL